MENVTQMITEEAINNSPALVEQIKAAENTLIPMTLGEVAQWLGSPMSTDD